MQLALIVDDSKTARIMLRKMLEKLQIPTAMVESGEDALEYLQENHPDVIFMDHMMPGMDGFSAVKAIKANPGIASIPIVMHTTKQGDIYVGQARALGASDILTKPATDQDLQAVLDRVKRQAAPLTKSPVPSVEVTAVANDDDESALSTRSEPRAADMEEAVPEVRPDIASVESPSFYGSFRQWLVALIWLIPTVWLLLLYMQQEQILAELRVEKNAYLDTAEWLLNQQPAYDYGEIPLNGQRLELLDGLMDKLERANFSGTVKLEGHMGEFCLMMVPLEDGRELEMLPPSDLPIVDCDVIGISNSLAMEQSVQQTVAFSRYLQSFAESSNSIRIEVVPYGTSQPRELYPDSLEGLTAGDWNAVALMNNRIKFELIPD